MAGASALNNYIDQDIDPLMERTQKRPTVTGRFSNRFVLITSLSLVFGGLILLSLTTWLAFGLGVLGIISYVVIYSLWAKRRFVSNTVIGSVSGAVPPLIGWTAITGEMHPIAVLLFLIVFIWQPPHFYALAIRRKNDYAAAKIPMLPVVKGFQRTKWHMLVWILLLFPIPFFLYEYIGNNIFFVAFSTLLNTIWLILAIRGFWARDDIKWASMMFFYSIQYLTVIYLGMIITTFFH
jgi:protoheme IX farnesyltransferase